MDNATPMDIVIVGGGYAGLACATRLARRAGAAKARVRIRLVSPQPVLVERIRLHQAATGQRLSERRFDKLLARCGVELVNGRATRIDPEARTLDVNDTTLHWDRLVLALGSQADAPSHTFPLEPDAAVSLWRRLQGLPDGAPVAVVGGGLTGIEAAAEIAESFPRLTVQLVSRGAIAQGFSREGREHVQGVLARKLGITLHEFVAVKGVLPDRIDTDAGPIPVEACVWAAGFRMPVLPREAGLAVNAHGQVLVDAQLRSLSHPHVYAAGDIAAVDGLPMGCKTALPTGAHAAENLVREVTGDALLPLDFLLPFFCVSLGRHEGLIQWPDNEGRLSGRILTGTRGALFKEAICRMTWWGLVWESRGRDAGAMWQRVRKGGRPAATTATA